MALLDVLLVVFVAILAFMGWRSGLIHETATLVGLALGVMFANAYYRDLGPLFLRWFSNGSVSELAAFVAILLLTWALVLVGGLILRDILQGLHLGWLDNIAGAILGLAKGLFMAEIIVLLLMVLPGQRWHDAVTHSLIGSRLAALGPSLVNMLPAVLRYWKPV